MKSQVLRTSYLPAIMELFSRFDTFQVHGLLVKDIRKFYIYLYKIVFYDYN